ncbi:hypothetical protein EVG20_g2211 [Dentipellis fragilis]|uniref:t-SNARE coiled-coil homology domain-containing protein n=1 Tax=Dentipellis fragilis TaxID=205917 RepID=A0A4Y9Z9V9_9AGAM|nr:hypothetical protein EVG20_g2211 [Dentipellis fragilis]
MSVDPYDAVQSEIQVSLQTAEQLCASYVRIRSTAREGSEELEWARSELKGTLAALEADLEDLDESVKIVESTGARMFGLDDAEVIKRRQYVAHVKREIESMRAEVNGEPPTYADVMSPPPTAGTPKPPLSPAASPRPDEDDHQAHWARQEQQMMIQQQDQTISSISGTLSTLAQQAGLMGREIGEHNEMLGDLEQGVDQSDTKLSSAMRRMRKFVRQTEETKSGWCIAILIVILVVLLTIVIFV